MREAFIHTDKEKHTFTHTNTHTHQVVDAMTDPQTHSFKSHLCQNVLGKILISLLFSSATPILGSKYSYCTKSTTEQKSMQLFIAAECLYKATKMMFNGMTLSNRTTEIPLD